MLSMTDQATQKMWEDEMSLQIKVPEDSYYCPQDEIIERAEMLRRVRIRIVGCGGAGCNTVDSLMEMGVSGADLLSINTDAPHLRRKRSMAKLLIGKRRTRGEGAGGFPKIGEEAALEEIIRIREMMGGSDITFVTCGLGGGTGTGSAPVVARAAKESGSVVISIVTLPFRSENKERMDNAMGGLEKLFMYSDTILAIPNDRIVSMSPSKKMDDAFKFADSVLAETITGLTELITKPGDINIDYADVSHVLRLGRTAVVGIGESSIGKEGVISAVKQAIEFPLLEADTGTAKGCLVSIVAGEDATLRDLEIAMTEIQARIRPDATMKFGVRYDEAMTGRIKVMALLVGVTSPYSVNAPEDIKNIERLVSDEKDHAEIDFIR